METIITLLIILIPLVFKAIGKKLEGAAGSAKPVTEEPTEDLTELLRKQFEEHVKKMNLPVEEEIPEVVQQTVYSPEQATVIESKPERKVSAVKKSQEYRKVPRKKGKILLEEEKKEKEKIDTKKLIVYSEIMKPKYME